MSRSAIPVEYNSLNDFKCNHKTSEHILKQHKNIVTKTYPHNIYIHSFVFMQPKPFLGLQSRYPHYYTTTLVFWLALKNDDAHVTSFSKTVWGNKLFTWHENSASNTYYQVYTLSNTRRRTHIKTYVFIQVPHIL